MKIAIDYRLAALSNRGMARYTREITRCLLEAHPETEWCLLVTPKGYAKVLQESPELEKRMVRLPWEGLVLSEQWGMAATVRKLKADVLWCPYNTMPLGNLGRTRLVVTVHDLIFMDPIVGGSLRQRLGALYRRFLIQRVCKRADRLCTVSVFTKTEIERRLGYPSDKICVTYNKVDGFLKLYIELLHSVKKEDYFFTVSGDAPHKNLPLLLRYFSEHPEERLVVAGVPVTSPLRGNVPTNVEFLPPVSDKELATQYIACKGFVFISKKEGFGLPVAEAIVAECPLLLSNTSSIPEVAGQLGVYVDPDSYESLCEGFERLKTVVVDGPSYHRQMDRFLGWEREANSVYAVCQSVLY